MYKYNKLIINKLIKTKLKLTSEEILEVKEILNEFIAMELTHLSKQLEEYENYNKDLLSMCLMIKRISFERDENTKLFIR